MPLKLQELRFSEKTGDGFFIQPVFLPARAFTKRRVGKGDLEGGRVVDAHAIGQRFDDVIAALFGDPRHRTRHVGADGHELQEAAEIIELRENRRLDVDVMPAFVTQPLDAGPNVAVCNLVHEAQVSRAITRDA